MKVTIISFVSLLAFSLIAFFLTVSANTDGSYVKAIDQHIYQQAASYDGQESFKMRQLGQTNLDRDDDPEIAVLYGLSRGNDTLMFLAVFEKIHIGSWHLVDQLSLGGRGLRHIDEFVVEPEAIRINAREFQGADPLCGPSQNVAITVTVTQGLLHISRVAAGDR